MHPRYTIRDTSSIFTPALLFYKDLIRHNIQECLKIAAAPEKLRPHCKTHKTREIIQMLLEAGITMHKCATLAEAEMLASVGVEDILLGYNLVGPNCKRLANFVKTFPDCTIAVLADHPAGVKMLSDALIGSGKNVGVMIDLDVGQHRTGIAPSSEAAALYEQIAEAPGLEPRGLHVYDGHNHQKDFSERQAAVHEQMEAVLSLRKDIEQKGLPVPTMTLGGTPTFPVYAKMDIPGMECSPGTCILHDNGYGTKFPDMDTFIPAAILLTRVISKPTANRITLDLGYKAVASDPPAGKRCILLNVPDYEAVLQNEEHLVIETKSADRFQPGEEIYAVPTHVCPTSAMHQQAYIIENGGVSECWKIAGRDRVLTV